MGRTARTVIVLFVALAAAAVAAYAVYRAVERRPVMEVEVSSVQAVVAARPVAVGTVLTKGDVKLVKWPASSPVPGSFSDISEVEERGLIASLEENEIVTQSKLAPREAGGGLPPSIPVGMRAISVKVNEVIGVAGFVIPGTRVDVVVTVPEGGGRGGMSRVVVSNVQVLTAGTRFDQEKARTDGKPIPSTVVTLLVTPEDAERVTLAQTEGKIMLALRNPLDDLAVETPGVAMGALLAPPGPPPVEKKVGGKKAMVAPAPPPEAAPKPYVVETIRAAKRTEEPIR